MKLLFDQNLSHRLCSTLADVFPGSAQVKQAGLDQASDDVIWDFARRESFVVVTLDADFADLAALRGSPPKVIWLRCGNQSTTFIASLIRDHALAIESLLASDDASCLEVYAAARPA